MVQSSLFFTIRHGPRGAMVTSEQGTIEQGNTEPSGIAAGSTVAYLESGRSDLTVPEYNLARQIWHRPCIQPADNSIPASNAPRMIESLSAQLNRNTATSLLIKVTSNC